MVYTMTLTDKAFATALKVLAVHPEDSEAWMVPKWDVIEEFNKAYSANLPLALELSGQDADPDFDLPEFP